MIRSSLLLSFVLLVNVVFGQSKVFSGKTINKEEYSSLRNTISKFDIYEIDASSIYQYLLNTGANNISLELGQQYKFNLDLRENKIFKAGIRVRVATENGIEAGKVPTIKCFQGSVHETGQAIALSVDENYFAGLITIDNRSLFIEPLSYLVPGAPTNYYVFYYSEDYQEKKEFKCIALDTKSYKNKIDNKIKTDKAKPEFAPLACKEVELAEASDQSMCSKYGTVSAVQNRITTVINNVQTNYCCNFTDNLTLIISDWFNVACGGTDPWSNSTDAETLLNSFTDWGPGNFGNHDIGELFTNRIFNGGTVGIAWVGVVCSDFQYNCIEDWTNNSNLIRVTVAHEMGHNFNCDHDASGSPFIMAPAVSNTNTWSALSISTFNAFVPTCTCLAACSGGSPPEVDFSSNKTGGCKPVTVTFTDLSTNNPSSWFWQFPGGTPTTSTAKNPVVVYNSIGSWDVTLTATNGSGSNTVTKDNFITIRDKPVASFTYVKNQGQVNFTSTSFDGVSFAWNFGDGDNSSDENPYHEYISPGIYTVTLTVTNPCGTSTKTQNITIVFIPLANFSSNVTDGCAPLVVSFFDESQFTPTSWSWTFPGGTPSSSLQQNPIVVYNNPGDYDVTLIATNISGSNTLTITKYIKVKATPVASFNYTVNGYTTVFTNTTTGTGNSYLWNFGDSNTSTQLSPVHTYSQPGTYTVTLTVTNICGSNTLTKTVTILAIPQASFSSDITTGCTALTVHFNDLSTNNPTSWKWILPGGTPNMSTSQNPIVVYNSAGLYNVSLIATNAIGSDTIVKTNYINALTVPAASFSSIINGNVVTFNNSSGGGISYLWNFGDGNTSTEVNPVHTYSQENTYTVTLTVTNTCGTNTITHSVQIILPPTAGFSSNVTSGCEPLTVQFNNTTSSNATYFNWSFPGGTPNTSVLENPNVTYTSAGSYNVTLIAGNSAGADTLTYNNFINVQSKPVTSFSYSNNNQITSFNNTTIGGTSYLWEFGDGNTSTLKNPTHIYAIEGSYIVKLTATNACGSKIFLMTIQVVFPPVANFSSNGNAGCNNLTVVFNDLSSPGTSAWQWSFPGGSPATSNNQNPVISYNSAGSYDVTLIATNSGGSDTIVKTGFVLISTAPPAANFSYTNFGLTYNFNNLSTDAYSYKWNFGDGGTSTVKNPVYNYSNNGNYTVKLIAYNGCGSDTFLLGVVVVGAPPVASFSSNLNSGCLPLIVNYTDNSIGGATSWLWSFAGGEPLASTDQNPTVVYNTAGTYEVQLIATNNFGSDTITSSMYVIVKGVPNAQFTYTSLGNLVKFTNTSTGGNTYLWNFGDGMTSTEINPNHSYSKSGNYTVTLTVTNECGSFTFTQTVDVKVSVNEISFIEGLSIYPNPNTGIFSISIKSQQKATIEVKVIDVIGREVQQTLWDLSVGSNIKQLNLKEATAGQYFVIIKSDNKLAVQKIIIE